MKKVFIGSSSESIKIANLIQHTIRKDRELNSKYRCQVWNQGTVPPSSYTAPSLVSTLQKKDYAMFVFGPDDVSQIRGGSYITVRDNVLFELGLAIGILGQENCFVFKEENVRMPSDLEGLTVIKYYADVDEKQLPAEIATAVTEFDMFVYDKVTPKREVVDWSSFCNNVIKICNSLRKSPRQNGFRFDVIVGISRGGIIAADLISRRYMGIIPVLCLFSDYANAQPDITFDNQVNDYVYKTIEEIGFKNILIVDDISRTGKTLVNITEKFRKKYPDKNVKSAVVYINDSCKDRVDYYGEAITNSSNIGMPYCIFDEDNYI